MGDRMTAAPDDDLIRDAAWDEEILYRPIHTGYKLPPPVVFRDAPEDEPDTPRKSLIARWKANR